MSFSGLEAFFNSKTWVMIKYVNMFAHISAVLKSLKVFSQLGRFIYCVTHLNLKRNSNKIWGFLVLFSATPNMLMLSSTTNMTRFSKKCF